MATVDPTIDVAQESPRTFGRARTRVDRVYRTFAYGAGFLTLIILFLIGLFLLIRATPALQEMGWGFLSTYEWVDAKPAIFGVGALLFGTFQVALIAIAIAVPVAVIVALFITEYAPRRVRKVLTSLVDLLAAVPSLIYGLWGFFFLQPKMLGLSQWLGDRLGFLPIFDTNESSNLASSPFIAGVVVALMVIPITTSVVREVFSQTPPGEKEAALALGGTRWGMIRAVVLPFGRGGIIGGSMLGLGRALGETIAVTLILSPIFEITPKILESGGNTIAMHIALRFSESSPLGLSALMAAGLVLFVVTLIVNMFASVVVAKSRSGQGVEI